MRHRERWKYVRSKGDRQIELASRPGSLAVIKLKRFRRGGAPGGASVCLKIGLLSGSPKRRLSAWAPLSSVLVVVAIWLSQLAASRCHAVLSTAPASATATTSELQVSSGGASTLLPPELAEASSSSELSLEAQWLSRVPRDKLCTLVWANQVNSLSLANNLITRLDDNAFVCLAASLRILNVQNNRLESLAEGAFNLLSQLQVLQLENNRLARLPSRRTLHPLRSLKHLNLAHNRIERLDSDALGPANGRLVSLDLRSNPVAQVSALALRHLTRLKTLSLSQWPAFQSAGPLWSYFEGLVELRFLHLDRTNLSGLPDNLCSHSPKLASLVLKSNQLERIPELSNCHKLLQLDLSYNKLVGPLSGNFSGWPSMLDLYLAHNRLNVLHADAFVGLKSLETLDLNHNQLVSIHPVAFLPLRASLKHLNVAQNSQLDWLPGAGLEQLVSLQAYGNQLLRRLPQLSRPKTLRLTYAYHCCDYVSPQGAQAADSAHRKPAMSLLSRLLELFGANNAPDEPTGGAVHQPAREEQQEPTIGSSTANLTNLILWPRNTDPSFGFHHHHDSPPHLSGQEHLLQLSHQASLGAQATGSATHHKAELMEEQIKTSCLPVPGPFLPCRDLFDTWWLRAGVWCVFLSAFGGNLLVIIVLGSAKRSSSSSALSTIMWPAGHSKRHIDVPRFLVINLALADLLMALYLGILALVDLSTLGEFRLYAIRWQRSAVCQLAGFLGVLSSELSVFILAIITLERNYAITNAVHLNRRLSLQKAVLIMLLGYAFALGMALIPLGGQLADYRKYSICLPLELADAAQPGGQSSSRMYMSTLLGINTLSFLLLLGCYLRMYCAIRGSQAWNANDLRIAKRMSVLVITDFLCWMPIILAALMALTGRTLVDAEGVKALAIFVLPLNSIANPFLYAITTKKFKRDLEHLSRRLGALLSCLGLARCRAQNGANESLFKRPDNGFHLRHADYHGNLLLEARKHRGTGSHHKQTTRGAKTGLLADAAAMNRQSMQPARRVVATRHQLTQTVAPPTNNNNNNNQTPNLNNTGYCYSCARQVQLQTAGSLSCSAGQLLSDDDPQCRALIQQPRILLERPLESSIVESQQESCNQLAEKLESAKGSALLCQACSLGSSPRRSPELGSVNLALPRAHNTNHNHRSDRELGQLGAPAPPQDQPNRCASACAQTTSGTASKLRAAGSNRYTGRRAAHACGSYDIAGAGRSRASSRSGGLSWLLLRPLAKAWSSIQISLAGSAWGSAQSGRGEPASPSAQVLLNAVNDSNHRLDDKSFSTNLGQLPGKPPELEVIGPCLKVSGVRRMSRSLDILTDYSLMAHQAAMDANSLLETTTTTTTTSSTQCDDRRNLLAANHQRASQLPPTVRGSAYQPGAGRARSRQACMRCRSWSPALFGKLEDCIYQIKSKIPGLNQSPPHHHQLVDSSTAQGSVLAADKCTSCSSNQSSTGRLSTGAGSNVVLDSDCELPMFENEPTGSGDDFQPESASDEEDKFNETEVATGPSWPHAKVRLANMRNSFAYVQQSGARVKLSRQQSSISDTISTRTAKTMLTNVGSSFESATNIPASSVVKK